MECARSRTCIICKFSTNIQFCTISLIRKRVDYRNKTCRTSHRFGYTHSIPFALKCFLILLTRGPISTPFSYISGISFNKCLKLHVIIIVKFCVSTILKVLLISFINNNLRRITQIESHIHHRGSFTGIIALVHQNKECLVHKKYGTTMCDPNNKEKYIGSDENWEKAESAIIQAAKEKGLNTVIEYGEAAFYGPKLDFMVRDAIGRKWQLGTIQVDYNLPERFDLTYKGADDKMHRPIMIHRAPFGSMERFVAVLLEHTGGKFPLWLSPDQVVVLPISEKFNDYAEKVSAYLNKYDIRSQVDDRNEKIGRKIRDNELKRIPYLLIVGEKEEAEGLVSVRAQGEGDKGQMTLEAFRDYMTDLVSHEIDANKMEQKN